ncbi:MAG TPA: YbaY family lipoprotein, partial [Steroidobacteraceae bacterium]|nr:YbaY family lipoprotein [Steroidobacteraceae bacterium]
MSKPEYPNFQTRRPGRSAALILGFMALCAMAGCDRTDEPDAALITGTVTSSEPITLPPAAVLELRLELASEDGTPAELLAVRREDNAGAL